MSYPEKSRRRQLIDKLQASLVRQLEGQLEPTPGQPGMVNLLAALSLATISDQLEDVIDRLGDIERHLDN